MEENTRNDNVNNSNLLFYDKVKNKNHLASSPHLRHKSVFNLYIKNLESVYQNSHQSNPKVLDLGSGDGSVTLPLLKLGAKVIAVDIS